MAKLDFSSAVSTDMENKVVDASVATLSTEGVSDQKETEYVNSEWTQQWGYFNAHPELKSAILMKTTWDVGKGYTADPETSVILDHISGMGKDTFEDVLFNADLVRYVGRDSFAEIIRAEDGTLLNLKPLDPSSISIIIDGKGIIKRYEQFNKLGPKKEAIHTFKPDEIFHLSNNRLADQMHGISVIESLDKTLLAEIESFEDVKKVMHRQAKPFIIFKIKSDDPDKIDPLIAKVDAIRNKGEDLFIPDDENILSYEVVQVNVGEIILAWRQEITNKFYRALGMPLVLFGAQGSTESGSKMEYTAHEQVFEREQRYLERQVWNQLGLKIDLVSPVSLIENLQTDERKDMSASGVPQGMEFQRGDMMAGAGA